MIKYYIEKLTSKENLTLEESKELMLLLMSGENSPTHIAAILTALKTKGETAEEVAGFVQTMREKSIKIKCEDENLIDVCGTGGDNSCSFNISTAVAFVAAGAGMKVAKHGNRSITSKSGSSDVLTELGCNINLSREISEEALNKIGITFLFAPLYHPAMKFVAPVRVSLGIKTVFNLLGPLTNPAGTKKQLIGTFNIKSAELMSKAVEFLDMERVCFVCADDKFDEISLSLTNSLFEFNKEYQTEIKLLHPEFFNYENFNEEEIKGNSPKENAKIILNVFENREENSAFQIIAANTALALYSGKYSEDIEECLKASEESILSGRAFQKLKEFGEFSNK